MSIYIPKGYRFSGVHCGLKSDLSQFDLSLIVSDIPAVAAGVFTSNLVCGAPVQVDRNRVPNRGFRVVVANSRFANACTGAGGVRDAEEMASLAAGYVGGDVRSGLVMSTGVIGVALPMDKIRSGIARAADNLTADEVGFLNAARGIMTTDTKEKYVTKKIMLGNGEAITVGGICKGAAMIAPRLATMLAVIFTDAMLDPEAAQNLLRVAADESFNCISVEGHTSTSDTLLFLANGAVRGDSLLGDDLELFSKVFRELCVELAVKIPEDGEGVTHLITIDVLGCKTREDAKSIARKVAEDVLVKTAIAGADPNWGRLISASGTAGVVYDPRNVSLQLNGFELFKNGEPVPFDKSTVSNSIRNNSATHILLTFSEGSAGIRFWTTDLTTEYIRLNSDYTT
jgi:glutamate N-acetyltransferase/amino-acid N-acetyltransferase